MSSQWKLQDALHELAFELISSLDDEPLKHSIENLLKAVQYPIIHEGLYREYGLVERLLELIQNESTDTLICANALKLVAVIIRCDSRAWSTMLQNDPVMRKIGYMLKSGDDITIEAALYGLHAILVQYTIWGDASWSHISLDDSMDFIVDNLILDHFMQLLSYGSSETSINLLLSQTLSCFVQIPLLRHKISMKNLLPHIRKLLESQELEIELAAAITVISWVDAVLNEGTQCAFEVHIMLNEGIFDAAVRAMGSEIALEQPKSYIPVGPSRSNSEGPGKHLENKLLPRVITVGPSIAYKFSQCIVQLRSQFEVYSGLRELTQDFVNLLLYHLSNPSKEIVLEDLNCLWLLMCAHFKPQHALSQRSSEDVDYSLIFESNLQVLDTPTVDYFHKACGLSKLMDILLHKPEHVGQPLRTIVIHLCTLLFRKAQLLDLEKLHQLLVQPFGPTVMSTVQLISQLSNSDGWDWQTARMPIAVKGHPTSNLIDKLAKLLSVRECLVCEDDADRDADATPLTKTAQTCTVAHTAVLICGIIRNSIKHLPPIAQLVQLSSDFRQPGTTLSSSPLRPLHLALDTLSRHMSDILDERQQHGCLADSSIVIWSATRWCLHTLSVSPITGDYLPSAVSRMFQNGAVQKLIPSWSPAELPHVPQCTGPLDEARYTHGGRGSIVEATAVVSTGLGPDLRSRLDVWHILQLVSLHPELRAGAEESCRAFFEHVALSVRHDGVPEAQRMACLWLLEGVLLSHVARASESGSSCHCSGWLVEQVFASGAMAILIQCSTQLHSTHRLQSTPIPDPDPTPKLRTAVRSLLVTMSDVPEYRQRLCQSGLVEVLLEQMCLVTLHAQTEQLSESMDWLHVLWNLSRSCEIKPLLRGELTLRVLMQLLRASESWLPAVDSMSESGSSGGYMGRSTEAASSGAKAEDAQASKVLVGSLERVQSSQSTASTGEAHVAGSLKKAESTSSKEQPALARQESANAPGSREEARKVWERVSLQAVICAANIFRGSRHINPFAEAPFMIHAQRVIPLLVALLRDLVRSKTAELELLYSCFYSVPEVSEMLEAVAAESQLAQELIDGNVVPLLLKVVASEAESKDSRRECSVTRAIATLSALAAHPPLRPAIRAAGSVPVLLKHVAAAQPELAQAAAACLIQLKALPNFMALASPLGPSSEIHTALETGTSAIIQDASPAIAPSTPSLKAASRQERHALSKAFMEAAEADLERGQVNSNTAVRASEASTAGEEGTFDVMKLGHQVLNVYYELQGLHEGVAELHGQMQRAFEGVYSTLTSLTTSVTRQSEQVRGHVQQEVKEARTRMEESCKLQILILENKMNAELAKLQDGFGSLSRQMQSLAKSNAQELLAIKTYHNRAGLFGPVGTYPVGIVEAPAMPIDEATMRAMLLPHQAGLSMAFSKQPRVSTSTTSSCASLGAAESPTSQVASIFTGGSAAVDSGHVQKRRPFTSRPAAHLKVSSSLPLLDNLKNKR